MVQQYTVRMGHPIRFSDGEQVIAVLALEHVPLSKDDMRITVLVEMP
jgi:hypothetical protein